MVSGIAPDRSVSRKALLSFKGHASQCKEYSKILPAV